MRLPLFIAYRYLFSKKKINAINIITGIAMLGFGVGAFAMIVVLSTFNGFENLVEGLINNYEPEIKITATNKKTFQFTDDVRSKILSLDEVVSASQSLEEKVVIKYNDRQEIARIRGVDSFFNRQKFDSLIVLGSFSLGDSTRNFGIFGAGLANKLNLFPGSQNLVTVFVPKRDVKYNALNPQASLSTEYLRASGLYVVHEEIDNEIFLTSLTFAQKLLTYPNSVSSIEINLKPNSDNSEVKEDLEQLLGESWTIKTRDELNEVIYKIFRSEKWFTYAILSLVLLISSFNIFGSLIMLVLDKKKDIGILKSMGIKAIFIRRIFAWQGTNIALIGGGIGIVLAIALVLAQQHIGLLIMENSIVDFYPVDLQLKDVLLTLLTVVLLGVFISIYPAIKASKTEINQLN